MITRFPGIFLPPPQGQWGFGRLLGSPVGDADLSLGFGVVDALHPAPWGHAGIDLPAPLFTMIKAPLDSVVAFVGFDLISAGHYIILSSGADRIHQMYAHLVEPSTFVLGDAVPAGAVIGLVGMTGLTTGPHLHWGLAPETNRWLRLGGELWNPLDHLVLPQVGAIELAGYVASGGLYVDEGEKPEFAGGRIIRILYPNPRAPGPERTP